MNIKGNFLKVVMVVFLIWLFAFLLINSTRLEVYRDGTVCVRVNRITGKISWARVTEGKWYSGDEKPSQ